MIAKALSKKILWSTFVQYFGKLIQIVIGTISIKLVTNALGVDEYGIYGKISEYALFFSVMVNLGIFGNVVRKMSEAPQDAKLFMNALYLRVGTALLVFIAGWAYAFLYLPDPTFALGVGFYLGALFFDYITTVCHGMLQANYRMGRAVLTLILGRLTILSVVLALTLHPESFGAPLYFLGPLAGAFMTMGLSLIFVRQQIKFEWKFDLSLTKMIFLTALPFGIINILNNLYFRFLPSFFAAKALTDAQFGSYNISLHIMSVASLLSTFLMFSTLPAFKQALKDKHYKRAKEMYKTIRSSLIGLAILMVGIGSTLAPTALKLIANKTFVLPELWFVLPLLLVLGAVSYFYDLVLLTLFAFEKEVWFLKREFIALAFAAVVLALSLSPANPGPRIALVILGAIVGELTMVSFGLIKIRREFDSY